jgi:AbiEi antitoxin C-terminal domain
MPRHAYVPESLRTAPFTLAQALLAGVTPDQLRGRSWRRIAQGWYRWEGCPGAGRARLASIAASLPGGGAFSGVTAARLHGLDLTEPDRPEVVVPAESTASGRAEAVVRKIQLPPRDVVWRDGLPVTSPLRTCFDLAGRRGR